MNKNLQWFSALALLALLTFPSCKEDEPTEEEVFLSKIGLSWQLSEEGVLLDDVPVNNVFNGFTISLTSQSSFSTSNGNAPIWPASGTFTLKKVGTTTGFNLVRSDGVEVFVDQLTEQRLVLRFQYVGQGGRTGSVSGEYVFDLEVKP